MDISMTMNLKSSNNPFSI